MDDMDDENKENGMYLQAAIIFHKKKLMIHFLKS